MEYVIFAIDNNTDTHTVAKFMRHIDTKRALGAMKGRMVQAIGYWEGILEPSYIMRKDDYLATAKDYGKRAVTYAKENPADVLLGVVTLLLLDIDDSLDDIEELESVQTYIDVQGYRG